MKPQTTKKFFAFIIIMMMFSALPQLASAQKNKPCPPGYKFECGGRPPYCGCVKNGNGKNFVAIATSQQSIAASFQIEHPTIISIKIYDATGRLIKTFTHSRMTQGEHQIAWDRKDEQGNAVSAGIYILRFDARSYSDKKKIIVINSQP